MVQHDMSIAMMRKSMSRIQWFLAMMSPVPSWQLPPPPPPPLGSSAIKQVLFTFLLEFVFPFFPPLLTFVRIDGLDPGEAEEEDEYQRGGSPGQEHQVCAGGDRGEN